MNTGGDAAEQVVRMSLEGVEVAARITGYGAKNTALLLAAVLREEQKTKGKARLTSMLKSGKELKVFSVQQKDLKQFSQEAKRYGVLYCVLKDKNNTSEKAMVDVIARAEDASKIQRITERFKLATIDTATVMGGIENERGRLRQEWPAQEAETGRKRRVMGQAVREENRANPGRARTAKGPLSVPDLNEADRSNGSNQAVSRPSVREKLNVYRATAEQERARRMKEREQSLADTQKLPAEVVALLQRMAGGKEKGR
ncbi:MAG: PcfB family protein [Firmicutes bacterium]|nr:PcfB family protein [Bacillota bacterium]